MKTWKPVFVIEFIFSLQGTTLSQCNHIHFLRIYPCMAEKVLSLGQILKILIFMNLHILKPFESKNHIFNCWFFCMCVCVCVSECGFYVSMLISKTQKPIATITGNLVFYMHIMHWWYLKHFVKVWQIVCVQEFTKRIRMHYSLWKEFLVSASHFI